MPSLQNEQNQKDYDILHTGKDILIIYFKMVNISSECIKSTENV